MTELKPEDARRAIVDHTRRLAESAAAAGPDAAVPTAPRWTVRDLVEHVGQTQHWVAEIIEQRITDPTRLPTQLAVLPSDPADWPAWLAESAQRAANACSDDALDAPVFNAAGDERTGGRFWMTSLLNEAVVHGFDAANAAGERLDVDPAIGAALVTNHLAMLTSPTWALQRPESAQAIRGTGQTLRWRATDTAADDASWLVVRRPDGATRHPDTRAAEAHDIAEVDDVADVTVSGPAGVLLLTLTRRIPLDAHDGNGVGTTVDGDRDLARHWIDNTAHDAG